MQEEKLNGEVVQNRFDNESAHHFDPHSPEMRKAQLSNFRYSPINKLSFKTKHIFRHKPNRWVALTLAGILLIIFLTVPALKYGLLNSLGFRATVNVTVLDETNDLPLKEVKVTVGEQAALTNKNGVASVKEVRLGNQRLTIEKIAYAGVEDNLLVKAGTNDPASFSLTPTGVQLEFTVVDWLSNTPLSAATLSTGENAVYTDDQGEAVLTIPPTDDTSVEVSVTADGYLAKTLTVKLADKTTTVKLVLSKKYIFISDKNDGFDLYSINLDGTDREILLRASGDENENIQLEISPDGRWAFMVSTRDGLKSDGAALYQLYMIDTESKQATQIVSSPSVRLYGFADEQLVYTAVSASALDEDPERDTLYSLDPVTQTKTALAKSNFYNAVLVTEEKIFFAPSEFYKSERMPYLFSINPDGSSKTVIHAQAVWGIFRTSFDKLVFDAKQDWYSLALDSSEPLALSKRPNDLFSRLYIASAESGEFMWVDFNEDGTATLMLHDPTLAKDQALVTANNLRYPLRFLSEHHISYRRGGSTARDYVLDRRGGSAAVITEVTPVLGSDKMFYNYE